MLLWKSFSCSTTVISFSAPKVILAAWSHHLLEGHLSHHKVKAKTKCRFWSGGRSALCAPFHTSRTTCHCRASICCMEIVQRLIDRLELVETVLITCGWADQGSKRCDGSVSQRRLGFYHLDWKKAAVMEDQCLRSFTCANVAVLCFKTAQFQGKFLTLKLQMQLNLKSVRYS